MPQHGWPLALHTWSLDTTPLAEAIAAARAAGFDSLELRRLDFTRCHEKGMTDADVVALVRAGRLPVAVLGVEYGWIFARGEESARLFRVFEASCANARALGCAMLMSAPGPYEGTLDEAVPNLRAAADIAAGHGLRLAFEFNSQHPVINRLEVLREMIARAGKANVGMLLDAYHLHRSGRPGRGFDEIDGSELFAFQYSDVPPVPVGAGIRRPTDRLLPGAGVVRWSEVFSLLAEKGFAGPLSYEAPNPVLWARDPEEHARAAVAATRDLLLAAPRRVAA
ncbi:sugar phosphate isomerase/epimerase family protein [Falsiroseomonas oryzae]|uniref:sugar phosphate isomerase/epimerase family protein n=1 Tax=Falsiroseomonas oryzae TaxID=2766473 RepID=UPI0022EB9B2D|nr:sugar phosphate isomerase/epimerase family protein [Roseomonas sp. MO-31]